MANLIGAGDMDQPTDDDTSRTAPSTPARAETCVGCGHITDQPTAVRIIEQSSGPGATLYACPGCAPRYGA